jgi:hypothetical protein
MKKYIKASIFILLISFLFTNLAQAQTFDIQKSNVSRKNATIRITHLLIRRSFKVDVNYRYNYWKMVDGKVKYDYLYSSKPTTMDYNDVREGVTYRELLLKLFLGSRHKDKIDAGWLWDSYTVTLTKNAQSPTDYTFDNNKVTISTWNTPW